MRCAGPYHTLLIKTLKWQLSCLDILETYQRENKSSEFSQDTNRKELKIGINDVILPGH